MAGETSVALALTVVTRQVVSHLVGPDRMVLVLAGIPQWPIIDHDKQSVRTAHAQVAR